MRIFPIVLIGLLSASLAYAKIYRVIDKSNGSVTFSDTPSQMADEVKLAEPQTFSAPRSSNVQQTPQVTTEPQTSAGTTPDSAISVSITSPTADQVFVNNAEGTLPVSVQVKPDGSRKKVQLLLDGSAAGAAAMATSFTLTNIDRGQHTVAAKLLDDNDKMLAESEPVTFFMQRPRILNRSPQ